MPVLLRPWPDARGAAERATEIRLSRPPNCGGGRFRKETVERSRPKSAGAGVLLHRTSPGTMIPACTLVQKVARGRQAFQVFVRNISRLPMYHRRVRQASAGELRARLGGARTPRPPGHCSKLEVPRAQLGQADQTQLVQAGRERGARAIELV